MKVRLHLTFIKLKPSQSQPQKYRELLVMTSSQSGASLHTKWLARACACTVEVISCQAAQDFNGGLFPMEYACHYSKMFKNHILGELHQDHPGSSQRKLPCSHLWWPGLDLNLENLVMTCTACLGVKQASAAAPLHPWVWSSKPWQHVHIDIAGPFMDRIFLLLVGSLFKWVR